MVFVIDDLTCHRKSTSGRPLFWHVMHTLVHGFCYNVSAALDFHTRSTTAGIRYGNDYQADGDLRKSVGVCPVNNLKSLLK
jgi:hypothetical protein